MSREIKFRVWDVVSKKFIYDIDNLFKNVSVIPSKIFSGEDKLLIVQQFTGAKDKNGQDVYDGDILEVDNMANKLYYNVIWCKHNCEWKIYRPSGDTSFWFKKYKVVGNIFENPKLC